MRITNGNQLAMEPKKPTFASFAYTEGNESSKDFKKSNSMNSNTSSIEFSRVPDKKFMREMKNMPKTTQIKRRIVVSDDEDGSFPRGNSFKRNKTPEKDGEWLESRDPSKISDKEREKNKQVALVERKMSTQAKGQTKVISKAKKPQYQDYYSGDDDILDDTPNKEKELKKLLIKSKLISDTLKEETDSEDDVLARLAKERIQAKNSSRTDRSLNRGNNATKKPVETLDVDDTDNKSTKTSKSSKKDVIELDENDNENDNDNKNGENILDTSDDDDEDNYDDDEELSQDQLREQAEKILKQCDNVSKNLRKSIKSWETGDDDDNDNEKSKGGGNGDKDCVNLITIHERRNNNGNNNNNNGEYFKPSYNNDNNINYNTAAAVLHEEDIARICPGLTLKAYQLVGVNWLKLLHLNNVNGVLADDMGLGKTIQTIAFLGWLQYRNNQDNYKKKPHVIVVPASTLANWQNEFKRFCPSIHVETYHGSMNERTNLRYEMKDMIYDGTLDVILTTYTLFERESGKVDRGFFYSQSFDYLILDEAHGIKNADSSRYINLNQIKTKHRLLLSGTPVQNEISELLAMLSFLMPNVFGRHNCDLLVRAFGWEKQQQQQRKENKNSKNNSSNNLAMSSSLSQLRSMLAPFVLRRLKQNVLDQLTSKKTQVVTLEMTEFQRTVYDSVLLSYAERKEKVKEQHELMNQQLNALDNIKKKGKSSTNNSSVDLVNLNKDSSNNKDSKSIERNKIDNAKSSKSSSNNSHRNSNNDSDNNGKKKEAIIDLSSPDRDIILNGSKNNKSDSSKNKTSNTKESSKTEKKSLSSKKNTTTTTDDKESIRDNSTIDDINSSINDSDSDSSSNSENREIIKIEVRSPSLSQASRKNLLDLTAANNNNNNNNNNDNKASTANVITIDDMEKASNILQHMSSSEAKHLFTSLRKAANHPLLLRVHYQDEEVMERIAMVAYHQEHFGNQCNYERVREEINKFSDFDLHYLCLEYPDSLGGLELDATTLYSSPKMKKLKELLPKLQAEGHRMLVFSQWTRLLDLLEVLLYDMDMSFLRLDGSTPVKERQQLIDTYTNDETIPVFLLSTKAGGLGINLTAADTVILHDLDFNPENDRQAEDRCHRIGQTKPVTVYKLVTSDTVDEDIYDMGERKRKLSQAVLSDDRLLSSNNNSGSIQKKNNDTPNNNNNNSNINKEDDINAISKILQKALAKKTKLANPLVID